MRYLNLGIVSAERSQAVYHAVAREARPGDEATLIVVSPRTPYVCAGFHQVTSREIDVEYCREQGIPIGRRMTGGGAVYLDQDQIFWHLILPESQVPVQRLYETWLQAPVRAYHRIGIAAEHRPVNDIVVGPRKIGGTGAATIGTSIVLVGSIMMDFDVDAMAKVLRVPSEKFRDKLVSGLSEYVTSIRRELAGQPLPEREQVTAILVEEFASILQEPARAGRLSQREQQALREFEELLFSEPFVFRSEGILRSGVKISEAVRLYEGVHKAPGGLIRLIYRTRDGLFDDVLLAGDFFAYPEDALERFSERLIGRKVCEEEWVLAAEWLMEEASIPGVGVEDLMQAFRATHGF
ncbi:biotin/lipoate A/B protein ligase family protein [Kyrpidia sp.]|uniref:lipoate--protein ligase family protein n=1 Tax=Kyrpidia sp. TaxID=2073077 RepID=UPI0018313764|nr:biotin/lipoate A/B protein ligase family protein [Kyrpidia sp.]MCL6575176.1 lipoate--protein ligase family protein [Kyrpidia sp.]HHY68321.1 lipoate--protein ligase family protein [Alicyclobacillus sp.]